MAGDSVAKAKWEKENVIVARVKVNRNQDPELYQYLKMSTNQAQSTRELLRAGLTNLQQKEQN